ncbi:MAG: hypothetical protein ACK5QW_00440 [Cyanobacteriota bacterium]
MFVPSLRSCRGAARAAAIFTLGSAAILAAAAVPSQAVEPWLVPVAHAVGGDPSFRGTVGYGLTLSQPRRLEHLGFWDALDDGLLSAHVVSLFDGSATLLASAVVPAGTMADLHDGFRWVPIPPLALVPGTYVLAASMEGDAASFDAVITDATISTVGVGLTLNPSGALRSEPVLPGDPLPVTWVPMLVDGGGGYLGPNLAPGPLPLVGAGAAWAWGRRLRQRCLTGECHRHLPARRLETPPR